MSGLNDSVWVWGFDNQGHLHFNPSKKDLVGPLSQEAVAEQSPLFNYNHGLISLALGPVVTAYLLLETNDFMLLENGDRLVLD